jgi:hypothetical protein
LSSDISQNLSLDSTSLLNRNGRVFPLEHSSESLYDMICINKRGMKKRKVDVDDETFTRMLGFVIIMCWRYIFFSFFFFFVVIYLSLPVEMDYGMLVKRCIVCVVNPSSSTKKSQTNSNDNNFFGEIHPSNPNISHTGNNKSPNNNSFFSEDVYSSSLPQLLSPSSLNGSSSPDTLWSLSSFEDEESFSSNSSIPELNDNEFKDDNFEELHDNSSELLQNPSCDLDGDDELSSHSSCSSLDLPQSVSPNAFLVSDNDTHEVFVNSQNILSSGDKNNHHLKIKFNSSNSLLKNTIRLKKSEKLREKEIIKNFLKKVYEKKTTKCNIRFSSTSSGKNSSHSLPYVEYKHNHLKKMTLAQMTEIIMDDDIGFFFFFFL